MDFEACRDHCLMQLQSIEDFPFGPDVYVYKVVGKVFAILSEQRTEQSATQGGQPRRFASINLKCDPIEALMLRQIFPGVTPGYHMNKQHWNTVLLDSSVPENEIKRMIENSYALVVKSLPKAKRPVLSQVSV